MTTIVFMDQPVVSFVIPTFNAAKYLPDCLKSIRAQQYPQDRIEIVIADGLSTDETVSIARQYGAKVVTNHRRDAQIGKAVALRNSRPDALFVCLLDADNELSAPNWLTEKTRALLEVPDVLGVETNYFPLPHDPPINRVSNLMRNEDPLMRQLVDVFRDSISIKGNGYEILEILPKCLPIFGANGFLWRRDVLFKFFTPDLESFDEADFSTRVVNNGYRKVIYFKELGIYHHHLSTFPGFIRKRIRNAKEYIERAGRKKGQDTDVLWTKHRSTTQLVVAILFCFSFFGPLFQAIVEYRRSKDWAWFLYPVLAFTGVLVYALVFLLYHPKDFRPTAEKKLSAQGMA